MTVGGTTNSIIHSVRFGVLPLVVDLLEALNTQERPELGTLALANVLVDISVSMAGYREEEEPCFPVVFFCTDVRGLVGLVGSTHVKLGSGPVSSATARDALQRCAPLCQGGWAMYLECSDSLLDYGLFRIPGFALSATPEDVFSRADLSATTVISIRAIASDVVELVAPGVQRLELHLSGARPRELNFDNALLRLCDAISKDVDSSRRRAVRDFLSPCLTRAIQKSHGTLIAVQKSSFEPQIYDGVWLNKPISLAESIADPASVPDGYEISQHLGTDYLIEGMVKSDGITLFSSGGKILAYRAFVDLQSDNDTEGGGGARSRAFRALTAHLSNNLTAILKVSQDGGIEFQEADDV